MANNISFSGIGSGIDFNSIRDAIINQRSRPISQLQSKVGNYNGRIDAFKQVNTLLATLTSASQTLTNNDLGTGRTATAVDDSIATATATSQANLGNINLNVARLATNLTQASRSYSSADAPIIVSGSTFPLPSQTSATFELRKGGASSGEKITINSTNNSLAGLRDAINAKDAGVTASIIDLKGDGTEQQLVLSSSETGARGRVQLVETSSTRTGADLNVRSLNPPDGDFSKLDAALTINGLAITRSTNDISDAVSGVTLSLKKVGATSISVSQSNDIEEKLKGFVDAYNAVQDFLGEQYKKDGKNRPTGILAGDSTLRSVQQQLRTAVSTISENNGGVLTSLSQIGITTKDDGHLDFDSAVLKDKLATNYDDVRSLLFGRTNAETGIFQNAYATLNGLSDNITGSVQTAINGYQTSVKSLDSSIASRTDNLNRLRDSLTRQFAAADAAIGQLNGQGTALSNVIKSLQPRNN